MSSPRKSLQEAFPDLQISTPSTSRTPSQSPSRSPRVNLPTGLKKTSSTGWPNWRSLRGNGPFAPTVQFTIRLADQLREEAEKLPVNPATIIAQARKVTMSEGQASFPEFWTQLETSLITLVYGSNRIESAGTGLQITIKLCQDVFRGKEVTIDINEKHHSYSDHLRDLTATNRKADKANVLRSRREVVFHAKALNFLIDRILLNNESWSEELILQTHSILYKDLGDEDVVPGTYRKHEVAVAYGEKKRSICLRSSAVPSYMANMIKELNNEISKSESTGSIDPYTLAARYHHQFVMIHPFADGNGRMSRIIMNVLLLKYAGHISLFGSEESEKHDYLDVVGRGRRIFDKEDMEVEFQGQTSHQEFAKFVLAKSRSSLRGVWDWASRKRYRSRSPDKN